MRLNDTAVSLIRTWVPIVVGTLVGWLWFEVSPEAQEDFAGAVTGLAIGAYYSLVRIAEQRWPWAGKLLGVAKTPNYVGTPPPP